MATVRRHAGDAPANRVWRWLNTPRDVELRLRVRPWTVWAGGLAAAAALALLRGRAAPAPQPGPGTQARAAPGDSVLGRLVLCAPGGRRGAVRRPDTTWT